VTTGAMQITSIDLSSKGNYLAGINSEEKVIVWNPDNKDDNFRIETTGKNIKVIRFKPDEDILAIGDVNGNVELWDVNLRRRISVVKAHTAAVSDIRFNPVHKQIATASTDKTLKIYNITDLTIPPISLSDNEGFVLAMQFSPDGQMIVSGTYEGTNTLIGRASHYDYFIGDICTLVKRNMTQEEWNTYVATDVPLELTCTTQDYNIKVNVKR
jgi:WD40 repeat protein